MKLFCFNHYNEQDANRPELPKAGSFAVVKVKVNFFKYTVIKKYWRNIKGQLGVLQKTTVVQEIRIEIVLKKNISFQAKHWFVYTVNKNEYI